MDKNKQLEALTKTIEFLDDGKATQAEVVEAFTAVFDVIKVLKDEIALDIKANKGETESHITGVLKEIDELELRTTKMSNRLEEKMLVDNIDIQKQLQEKVNSIKELIPQIPSFKPLEDRIDDVERKIPKIPKETAIEETRNRLEGLKGDNRLDISAVRGLTKRFSALSDAIVNRALGILDNRTAFLINKVSNLQKKVDNIDTSGGSGGHTIQDEGTPLTARTNLNFVGTGVTATDDAGNDATKVTINAGAGSLSVETPVGLVNDSNTSFTVSNEPVFIVVNGLTYAEGTGLYTSYVAGTITLSGAIGTGGFIRSFY